MKKIRRKYRASWKNEVASGMGELALCLVIIALAGAIFAIFTRISGSKASLELFIFLSSIAVCLLIGLALAIATVVKNSKKAILERKHKKCFSTVVELYKALTPITDCVSLNEDKGELLIKIGLDELAIYGESLRYRVCLNNETDAVGVSDKDIYYYALEFLHDKRNDICELEIYDTQIKQIDDTGITYTDDFEREQYIIFNDCISDEYSTHVATYDTEKGTVRFSFSNARVNVVFHSLYTNKSLLKGGRKARFNALKSLLEINGYTLKKQFSSRDR